MHTSASISQHYYNLPSRLYPASLIGYVRQDRTHPRDLPVLVIESTSNQSYE